MNDIERKLRDAGADVDGARLSEAAFAAIKRNRARGERNGFDSRTVIVETAAMDLFSVVMNDARLLAALFSLTRENVKQRVDEYVANRFADMAGGAAAAKQSQQPGGSHLVIDRQREDDAAGLQPVQGGEGSHTTAERHNSHDPLSTARSTRSGASRSPDGRQEGPDRPASHPAPLKTPKGTLMRAAQSGVYARVIRIGGIETPVGVLCQFDALNLEVNGAVVAAVLAELRKIKWPDMYTQLSNFQPEQETRAMLDRIDAARGAALHAVKSLPVTHAD